MKKQLKWVLIAILCFCIPVLMGQMYYYYSTYWGMMESAAPTAMSNAGHIYVDPNNDLRYQDEAGTSIWLMESTTDATYTTAEDIHVTGTTPQVKIGDGDQEDTSVLLDGNAQDFYIALDDTTDDLTIGTGSTIGSNVKMVVENGGNVGIGDTSPDAQIDIQCSAADTVGLIVQGAASQSADLLQILNSSGTQGFTVEVDGDITSAGFIRLEKAYNGSTYGALDIGGEIIRQFDESKNIRFYIQGSEIARFKNTGELGLNTTSPSSLLDIEKSGTAKSNISLLELTNSVSAADMDGTETEILVNQYYYDPNTPAVVDMAKIVFGTEQDWTSTASTQDAYVSFKTVLNGTMTEHARLTSAGTWTVQGYNGAALNLNKITEEVTIPVGSGADPVVLSSSNLAPAGSLIMGVTFRVTDAPGGGAATIDIGRTNGGNLDEFIDGASCDVLGETGDNYTNGDAAHTGIQRNISADTFTLTTDADVTDNEMKVRIIVWYRTITVPTS